MKEQYAEDLREGTKVDATFAVRSREVRATRSGEAFLSFEFADRSGRIPAVMFKPDAAALDFGPGDVVRVRGAVTSYRGQRRVSVESLRAADGVAREDLVAAGRLDGVELAGFLRYLAGEVHGPGLRAVLGTFFRDAAFMERFCACPASRGRHHAYLGGLLEHTVAVATLAEHLGQLYAYVDRDLLLAGALLHDVGKVEELEYDTAIGYTDEGRMLGHVVIGARMVAEAASRAGTRLARETGLRLEHVVLSHHGELEWGSPRRPATLEAILLHHADNLDAKAAGFIDAVSRGTPPGSRWTDMSNLFRRPLYAPRAAEDDRSRPADEDEEYCMEGVPAGIV